MAEPIRLMHYDPRWPQEFEQTRSTIFQSCEGLVVDIQHVGSTAIPGLIARPVVDCVAQVETPSAMEEATLLIEGVNFALQPLPEWLGEGRLLARPRHGEATHHVYLFSRSSPWPARMIAHRDQFLADPDLAIRFEESKVAAWKQSLGEPRAYAASKQPFFETAP